MAQITKQKVMEMAVTLAAGMFSNVSRRGQWQIFNTLQDCVNAVGQIAESLGYEIVLEYEAKPYPQMYYCGYGVEPTDDSDDTANDKGEKE
jgi:hypothetical protein